MKEAQMGALADRKVSPEVGVDGQAARQAEVVLAERAAIASIRETISTDRSSTARSLHPTCATSLSTTPFVRASLHTMALCSGFPVVRSQTTVVSRWFVMPAASDRDRLDEVRSCCGHMRAANRCKLCYTQNQAIRVKQNAASETTGGGAPTAAMSYLLSLASSTPAMHSLTPARIATGSCSTHL
jgi:hypothetical protein